MVARRFRRPDPGWLRANADHPAAGDDWVEAAAMLVDARRAGELAPKPPLARRGGGLRDVWERKTVLGREDRTLAGAVALAVVVPLRAGGRYARWVRMVRSIATPPAL